MRIHVVFVAFAALASMGCKVCISKIGVESKPGSARVYIRGDSDVSFSPLPKIAGGKHTTMTTPDNITFRWEKLPKAKKIWVKVIWGENEASQVESEPVEIAKCENARLTFTKGQPPVKEPVEVVDDASAPLVGPRVSMNVQAEGCD